MLRHIGKLVSFTLADGGKLVAGSLSFLFHLTNKVKMNTSCFGRIGKLREKGESVTDFFLNLVKTTRLNNNARVFDKLGNPPVLAVLNTGSKRIHVLLFHSDLLVDFTSHEIVNLLVAPHGSVLLANPDSSMVTALFNRELLTCSFCKVGDIFKNVFPLRHNDSIAN